MIPEGTHPAVIVEYQDIKLSQSGGYHSLPVRVYSQGELVFAYFCGNLTTLGFILRTVPIGTHVRLKVKHVVIDGKTYLRGDIMAGE